MKPINSVIVASAIAIAISGVSARAYEEGPVAQGGTIEGKVIFNGELETRKIIPNKDLDVCDGPREEPLIEVGPDKGVQNAVVYLVGVAKGKAWPAEAQQVKTPELVNHNCRFEPHVQVIRAGPLVVVNDDPMLHNTHGYYGKRTAAGWKVGSTWWTTPTTPSPAPTASSRSLMSRPAPTTWWRFNHLLGPFSSR